MSSKTATTSALLNEYAGALRGDWGDIDGRSEQMSLNELSAAIVEHGNAELTPELTQKLRGDLGICRDGGSHWEHWCRTYECEQPS